jgi:hypothetical protein
MAFYSHSKRGKADVYHGPFSAYEEAERCLNYVYAIHRHKKVGVEQHETNPQLRQPFAWETSEEYQARLDKGANYKQQ